MADFVHYVARRIVLLNHEDKNSPWFSKNQPDDQGLNRPFFHTTRKLTGPPARIRPGDTLWIFSQLHSPWGKLFPALDAKITVAEVIRRTDRIEYIADESSSWVPLLDATSTLNDLRTKPAKGKPCQLLHDNLPVGFSLRSIREVCENWPLLDLAQRISDSRLYFISYRIADGTELAFRFCKQIAGDGIPIFWDRWSLPRRLAERRELIGNLALDEYLQEIIRSPSCLRVYGINSPKYGSHGSYSERERDIAIEHNKYIELAG